MAVILASQSPRRRELLERIGLPFDIVTADVDETMDEKRPPQDEAARLSRQKAAAVQARGYGQDIIIAADTIVVIGGQVLGKPRDRQEAAKMLALLSGREHQVITALTVMQGKKTVTHIETAQVRFRTLTQKEIGAYIATGEPMDKAGAYGIQGFGSMLVAGITGDYYAVMGLPVCALAQILTASFAVELLPGAGQ